MKLREIVFLQQLKIESQRNCLFEAIFYIYKLLQKFNLREKNHINKLVSENIFSC